EGRVPACTAGGQDDPVDAAKLLRREIETAEFGRAVLLVQAAAHRVFDRLWLLVNLLEHVMRKAGQLDVSFFDRQVMYQVFDPAVLAVGHIQRVGGDESNLMISQINDLFGVAGEWGSVAGDEMLAMTDANDEWAALTRRDNQPRIVAEQNHEAIRAT